MHPLLFFLCAVLALTLGCIVGVAVGVLCISRTMSEAKYQLDTEGYVQEVDSVFRDYLDLEAE
jgi:membrane protein DedA with SNARE-associated domain